MSEHDQTPQAPSPGAATPLLSRAAWVRIIPFLVYLAFIVLADVLARLGVPPASLRWLYAVKVGAVLLMLLIFRKEYTELQRWEISPMWMALSAAVGVLVLLLWINLNAGWMLIGKPDGFNPTDAGRIDWLMVAVRIAGAALVVPVMEELFWRSFLMRWLDNADFLALPPAAVTLRSVAIGAVLFGFEHNLWLAGIVAGVAYSFLYMRQRTLWSAVVAHAVTNGALGIWIVRTSNWTYW